MGIFNKSGEARDDAGYQFRDDVRLTKQISAKSLENKIEHALAYGRYISYRQS